MSNNKWFSLCVHTPLGQTCWQEALDINLQHLDLHSTIVSTHGPTKSMD